ncbi:MAG: BON domain-containing protein [Candidatus Binatia bacterium]
MALTLWGVMPVVADDYGADNTGKNVRDRDPDALTPGDQSNDAADIAITAQVRKKLVANDALSTNAHNVKVITRSGVVTLRGPVNTPEEKLAVVTTAQKVPGVAQVNDQLEVASGE